MQIVKPFSNLFIDLEKVAIIVLDYKGWKDTIECLESLQKIEYPDYLIIVVDNASSDGSIERIKSWAGENSIFVAEYTKEVAEQGGTYELEEELHKYPNDKKIVLIKNNANLGYSAGNNVGIRYSIKKNADAVLIINPDVRIENAQTLTEMVNVMFSDDKIYVVGPNIIDEEGNGQSPLREPSFFEEAVNPFLSAIKKPIRYISPLKSTQPFEVEKVLGSCVLIRTDFLRKINLLDESVFLYCEEPILAAQVKSNDGKIFYVPPITVRHLHKKPQSEMMAYFFKSRLYYLRHYKKYNFFQLTYLTFLYKLLHKYFIKH